MQTFTKRFSFMLAMIGLLTVSISAQTATLQRADNSNKLIETTRTQTSNTQQRVDVLPISDFSDGAMWTTESGIAGDTSLWEVTTNTAINGTFTRSTVASPTAANGFGVINFDAYTGGNTATPDVVNYLTSPIYDVSSLDSGNVYQLTFYSIQRYCCVFQTGNAARVSFSYDGGATFTEPVIAQKFLGANDVFEGTESVRLPAGVDTTTQFQVRFNYEGAFYFWAVDDIEISVLPNIEIELRDNFYAVAPYVSIPQEQVQDSIRFLVDVLNNGASNDTFDVVGSVFTVVGGALGDLVFVDTLRYTGVAYDSLAENQSFPNSFPTPTEAGTYVLIYQVSNFDAMEADADANNDAIQFIFDVNADGTYAKVSQSITGLRSVDDDDGSIGYEVGNFYYMPNPSGWQIDSVTFQSFNRSFANAAELEAVELEVVIYGFTGDLDGDGNSSGDDEMEDLETGVFQFTGNLLGGAGDRVDQTVVFDDPVILTDDYTSYGASVLYFEPPTIADGVIFIGTGESYGATAFANPDTTYRHSFSRETFDNEDFTYAALGDGAPNITLHMSRIPSSVSETELPTSAFSVRPNPATTQFAIDFDFGTTVNAQFEIINAVGQTVSAFNRDGLSSGAITIPTQGMNNGLYYVKVRTDDGQTASRKLLLKR